MCHLLLYVANRTNINNSIKTLLFDLAATSSQYNNSNVKASSVILRINQTVIKLVYIYLSFIVISCATIGL